MAEAVTTGAVTTGAVTLEARRLPGADVDAIEAALAGLRRRSERTGVRTAVCTLVAVTDDARCATVLDTVARLAGAHPVHCIAVVPGDPAGPPGIDAEVRVRCQFLAERAVCTEEVRLEISGPALGHLDSVVAPLALPDLPVAVWHPAALPGPADPLLGLTDLLVVDTKEAGGAAALPAALSLARRVPVADLSWVRLAPWRELLAGLFEGAAFRPFLAGVRRVRVAGKPAPSRLMAGWVCSRLGLDPAVASVTDHRHVTVELDATHAGRHGRFVVARSTGERIVTARAAVEGGPAHGRVLRLRPRDPARVLGQALARMGRDPVWEQAVATAAALAP